LKDPGALDQAITALEQALGAKDASGIERTIAALEARLGAEPGLKLKSSTRETVEWLLPALIVAALIRVFIFEPFRIPSSSMENTLLIGDHLFVKKWSYGVRLPFGRQWLWQNEGPVAVFKYPGDNKTAYIKRVIGLPGDTIKLRDGILYRNGEKVIEPYAYHLDPMRPISPLDDLDVNQFPARQTGDQSAVTVPPGHYFMMGDNRNNSSDSRFWGFVPRENLVGSAWLIYWSSQGCLPFDGRDCDLRLGRLAANVQRLSLDRQPDLP
jgi:signal peptidase I